MFLTAMGREKAVLGAAISAGVRKGKDLFMPLRLALTGLEHGPELKLMLPLIGEAETRRRLSE